ncbi:MAG: hypothetical protein WBY53_20490 [Acidobacteriaceae bacterium]
MSRWCEGCLWTLGGIGHNGGAIEEDSAKHVRIRTTRQLHDVDVVRLA